MSKQSKSNVLIIDDKPEDSTALKGNLDLKIKKVQVSAPSEIEESELLAADLILVDFDLSEWPERDGLIPISLKPVDGLALSSILRRKSTQKQNASAQLKTTALHELDGPQNTGQLKGEKYRRPSCRWPLGLAVDFFFIQPGAVKMSHLGHGLQ